METANLGNKDIKSRIPAGLDRPGALKLYETMFLLRAFELKAQDLYKRGLLPGFLHLYVGEEAVASGVCAHLRADDWITSTHRGHGHSLAKGLPPRLLMAELAGKATGCCGGRGGSMHLYHPPVGLFGTNGIVAGGIPSAVGIGLGAKIRGTDQVAVAFFGDGAVNHGSFHESMNLAAIQAAPVVFICENNLYATCTPLSKATLNTEVTGKAAAYGMPAVTVDGNDVLAVWEAMRLAVGRARAGEGPTLIEAKTYRQVGHHEGDQVYGTYRTKEEVEQWKARCPIKHWRRRLVEEWEWAEAEELDALEEGVRQTIEDAVTFSRESPDCDPATLHEHIWARPIHPPAAAGENTSVEQTWLEAVRDGIAEEMRRQPGMIYFGEGIGERGGSFGHTKGLWQEFGGGRVIDTPICELAFTGASLGAAATGSPAVADMMFADFIFEAASQIIQQAAKLRYMSCGQVQVPMVVRAGSGVIKSAGPQHSGTYHSMWAHVPGLIVVMPSTPAEAKGLMKMALRTSDPVIFLEPKALFAIKGEVPVGEDVLLPLGQARIVRAGRDLTLVTCGLMVHRSLEAAARLEAEGLSCEIIDLRTIAPLDVKTITASVARTHRLLVVDEGWAACGIGAEIAACMMEHAFAELHGPIGRLHTEPVAYPFSPVLENVAVPSVERIVQAARDVVAGIAPIQYRLQADWNDAPAPAPSIQDSSVFVPPTPTASPALASSLGPQRAEPAPGEGEPLCMPHGDLTVEGGTIVRWLKQVGETVQAGEPVVEVETEKAVVEIEAPVAGVLIAVLVPEPGTPVKHGQQLGTIQAR